MPIHLSGKGQGSLGQGRGRPRPPGEREREGRQEGGVVSLPFPCPTLPIPHPQPHPNAPRVHASKRPMPEFFLAFRLHGRKGLGAAVSLLRQRRSGRVAVADLWVRFGKTSTCPDQLQNDQTNAHFLKIEKTCTCFFEKLVKGNLLSPSTCAMSF